MSVQILLIQENQAIRDMMKEALSGMGLDVKCAATTSEAAKLISSEPFNGILMDPMMPLASGAELTRFVRQSSQNRNTPIFIMSVQHENYATASAIDHCGTYLLKEPIESEGFARLLDGTRGIPPNIRPRNPRSPALIEVTRLGAPDVKGMGIDISEDGILYRDGGSVAVGIPVQLSFSLPEDQRPLNVTGVVARVDEKQRTLVCFTDITQEDRQRIKDFLAVKATT